MDLATLTLALLALLMTPGPTNTLVLLAATEGGWRRLARVIPAELAAYMAVILPLALLSDRIAGTMGAVRPVVAVLAGIWVLYLAIQLWRPVADGGGRGQVTARRVALTTMLNPKGLVMGFVLIPAAGLSPSSIATLAACIVGVALVWGALGLALPRTGRAAPDRGLLRRAASVWLAGLSVFLLLGGIGSA